MKKYDGKIVFITGGSSGIGLCLAREVASHGARVAIFGRDQARLASAEREINAVRGGEARAVGFSVDVGDLAAVGACMEKAVAAMGAPDILITCAGITNAKKFVEQPGEEFEAVIRTNLFGTVWAIKALVPHMRGRNATIAIVGSLAGIMGCYGYSAYSSSKFAQVGLAETLCWELKEEGIRVCSFCPAEVDTPLVANEIAPIQTRVTKDLIGTISARFAAESLMKGIDRDHYLIIPGWRAKLFYLVGKLSPKKLSFAITHTLVGFLSRRAQKRRNP